MLVGAFLERGIFTHLFRLFICVRLIVSVRRSKLHLCECLWPPFLEREIFTHSAHFIHLFICVLCCPLECLGVSLCMWAPLACMVTSRLWQFESSRLGSSRSAPTWRLVSDRYDPPTFSGVEGVDVHYMKFTSAILFRGMTSGVMVETVGNNLWRVVTIRQAVTIHLKSSPHLRPVTDQVYWTWVKKFENN